MKVAVFAGTEVDTKMGRDLLLENNIESIMYPISKNPKEQSKLQYYSVEELTKIVEEKIEESKTLGAEKVFIYCNSLSGSVDLEYLREKTKMEIITPIDVYKNLNKKYKNVAILAANSKSAHEIDKIICKEEFRNTITMGNLGIVEEIEKKISPEEIVNKLALGKLFYYFNEIQENKLDLIILGCTHFPYIKEELEKLTHIEILDPADEMIEMLMI
ncbi:aspartate/glutamate racemase family protein [Peptoniphilus sp. MSJ-1]|uniref:Aspartate/glutamate racemase family protein n=1 Tax=Peptoniphilus ovalis TaxID=2841503 RepID=A0ABS6FFD1_9FIRM|nr:aspartate/glutamate racemase family protein [Peptoniphilus ovalis]MBU5668666.1 aspartate/glutamate racemase family protein [Peptoniphilus ovalis]